MKQSIQEAAYDYATEQTKWRKDVLKEVDADNYVSRHADCMGDFEAGAQWCIHSVWHDNTEIPEERKFCVYVQKGGNYGAGYYHKNDNSMWIDNFSTVEKWAYFDDLLPETKVDRNPLKYALYIWKI